ncbi:MAG: hypothetical protein EBQ56_15340 [Proteobacteria bacterium]|nr:hypothetical protein [Pseudomonadota bacterium]NBY49114.1 hypothetical protein [Pseudomonadota bacterium]NDB73489.1 hypothetical protein [Pseudomonadota bacterium]HAH14929.1 hypothetical protein [Chloroflexota bacterium]HAN15347.1 hypothetical protein [Chloroflexota bacterium]
MDDPGVCTGVMAGCARPSGSRLAIGHLSVGSMWERTEPIDVGVSVVWRAGRFRRVGDGVGGTVRPTGEGTSFVGRISVLPMREACAFMTANLNGQLG